MVWASIAAAVVVMIISLVGVVVVMKTVAHFLEKRLPYLVSFSAGVFLVTAGSITVEVLEIARTWYVGSALIFGGYTVAWAIHHLLPETHHHHDPQCHEGHGRSARKLLVGDSLHNIADGVMLVSAFAITPMLGIAVTVSIVLHEALQEIAEFFVLRHAGYAVRHALLLNLVTASTIFIGVGLGLLAMATADVELLLLAFSAGFFFHVVVHDIWPSQTERASETSSRFIHWCLLALGITLMVIVSLMMGDVHVHGADVRSSSHAILG
jgi:zinc and cadmium transporter